MHGQPTMKILCLAAIVALLHYSEAVPASCERCDGGVACAKLDWATAKETCTEPNNLGCYRQLKSGVLLNAGCADAALKTAAGGKSGECDTDTSDIQTCFCDDKDDCNGASFLRLNVLVLATALVAAACL